jgi:hypothetical protein
VEIKEVQVPGIRAMAGLLALRLTRETLVVRVHFGGGMRSFFARHLFGVVTLAALVSIVGILSIRALWVARESARQSSCHGRMFKIHKALLDYHLTSGHFPPAFIKGPDGTAWHSWRVLILRQLDEDEVYRQYRFDEPWNGPNNRMLADKITLEHFQCCSGKDYGQTLLTNFCVVNGDQTAFPGMATASIDNLLDQPSETIVLVEVADSNIHWMEPRDLSIDELYPTSGPSLGSPHVESIRMMRADGRLVRLPRKTPIEELRRQLSLLP